VQHALRAFTPLDQKSVKAAAQTFRANPAFDTGDAITQLGVGEALVSVLDDKGSPTVVDRVLIRPPLSAVGAISSDLRAQAIAHSPFAGVYDTPVNRESAAEVLAGRLNGAAATKPGGAPSSASIWGAVATTVVAAAASSAGRAAINSVIRSATGSTSGRKGDSIGEAALKGALRTAGGTVGRELVRGVMGALFK
jgi:hypothetical protein